MRRLMLLRHAKTEPDSPSGRDEDRRLDQRGHYDAAEIGGWMRGHPPFPSHVLVSHAVRAVQTWEIAWEAMKDAVPHPQVDLTPELYGADVSQLLETIRDAAVADPKRLMLVGHNPGMHELAISLAGSGNPAGRSALADNLPTAGLVILDFAIEDWTDVGLQRGRLELFVSPRLIKQASGENN
jgi:phosphohistidine phosphatase